MRHQAYASLTVVFGLMASLFLFAYQYVYGAVTSTVAHGMQCTPVAGEHLEKENPNRIFFISCGGFL